MRRLALPLLALALVRCDCAGGDAIVRAETRLAFDPEALAFGDVALAASRSLSVIVTNEGTTSVKLGPARIDGPDAFALDNAPDLELLQRKSFEVSVTFTPRTLGDFEGTLTIEADGEPHTFPITGRGVEPRVEVDTGEQKCDGAEGSVSFGQTPVGQPVERTITVRSAGTATVTLTGVAFETTNPELSVVGTPQGARIAPGASRAVTVRYLPADTGPDANRLVIRTDAAGQERIVIPLCGEGTRPALCATPVPLDIGGVTIGLTATARLKVENCGTQPLPIASAALSSDAMYPSSPAFSATAASRPATLDPGQSFDVSVTFAPTALGPASAFVKVDTGGATPPAYFPVNGSGAEDCTLTALPAVLNFWNVPAGGGADQMVVINNESAMRCTVAAIQVTQGSRAFSVTAPPALPNAIAPGGSMTLTVHYTPLTPGMPDRGELEIAGGRAPLRVPLNGNAPNPPGCMLQVAPPMLNFGAVANGGSATRQLTLTNASQSTQCMVSGATVDMASTPGFTVGTVPASLAPGQSAMVEVTFRPTRTGQAQGTLRVASDDRNSPAVVMLFAASPAPGICVDPRMLSFGMVRGSRDLTFNVTACGSQALTISGLPFTTPDAQFTLVGVPALPFNLASGATQVITVRYTPSASTQSAHAVVSVNSNDAGAPMVPVTLDGGAAIVPPQAGQYLYSWSVSGGLGGGGDIIRLPLQGGGAAQAYWGPSTGKNCSGCHSLSTDGRYVALIDYSLIPGIRIIDTMMNMELGARFLASGAFITSWRPDPNSNPRYQFAYDDGQAVLIGSISGRLRALQGAEGNTMLQSRMPSWGPNGKIAFVRGQTDTSMNTPSGYGLRGPTSDIMTVDEGGGTAQPLAGASGNGMLNYYPSYSPDGRWIAITVSRGNRTYAAPDSEIRLVAADGSGTVRMLPMANAGAGGASFPTWSRDGSLLSFSSNRAGGRGDWDIWYVPIDLTTGMETGAPMNLSQANTAGFDHVARWSP